MCVKLQSPVETKPRLYRYHEERVQQIDDHGAIDVSFDRKDYGILNFKEI